MRAQVPAFQPRAKGVAALEARVPDVGAGARGVRFNFVKRLVDRLPGDELQFLVGWQVERHHHHVVGGGM